MGIKVSQYPTEAITYGNDDLLDVSVLISPGVWDSQKTKYSTFKSAILAASITSTLTSAHLLVGNASNVATSVAMSGDVSITNAGATTVNFIGGKLISLANSFSTLGNFGLTFTQTATTSVTLPTTGTLATLAGTETLTNKTLSTGTKVLVGSDATGDIYYNGGSGAFTRIPIGSSGYLLTVTGGVPTWSAPAVSLPSQTGNSGKYLTTDGSTASWVTIAYETTANKATDFSVLNNTLYPTTLAVNNLVSSVVAGLQIKLTATVATAAALPANIYNNGSSGVGATLTAVSLGALTVDGYAVALNDYVLVKNEVTAANNGLYQCTIAGAIGVAYVLTRTTDMNVASEFSGAFVPVGSLGSVNPNSLWLCNPSGTVTVGTTSIPFTQLNGATDLIQGSGISISGNTISVATGGVTNAMLVSMAWSKVTSTPTTLSGYGITDALSTTLNSAKILVGNVSNIATSVSMSGDATIDNAGAVTVAASIARLASPAFTGNPTAPTQSAGNNSTRIATTAYVDTINNDLDFHLLSTFRVLTNN